MSLQVAMLDVCSSFIVLSLSVNCTWDTSASRTMDPSYRLQGFRLGFHVPGFVQTSSFGFRGLVVEWGSRRRVSDHIQD